MIPIKYVCSLGNRCHTAYLLKKCNLKKTSYPFDWIFSDLYMILHCIEDNFNKFLNKSKLNILLYFYYIVLKLKLNFFFFICFFLYSILFLFQLHFLII